MKKSFAIAILSLFILNSCIVKSLHPFFTNKTISYQEMFLGDWETAKKNEHWKIQSYRKLFLKEKKISELSEKELRNYNYSKKSYLITYTDEDLSKVSFLATPFIINKQLFLDFSPLENFDECNTLNTLSLLHITMTHSLVKFDILEDKSVVLSWFDEDRVKELFQENLIKIKHEKIKPNNDILLTASSEQLQKFIKKYINSKKPEKWKTDLKFTLKKKNDEI